MNKLTKKIILKIYRRYIHTCNDKSLYTVCTSSDFVDKLYNMDSSLEAYKFFSKCKKSDDILSVSKNSGLKIEEFLRDKDVVVGIYSTTFRENELQSSRVNSIINKGIHLTNKTYEIPKLSKNIYFPKNIIEAMDTIRKDCKDSKIDFILIFPRSIMNENGRYNTDSFNSIFEADINGVYIKPKFIDSYVVSTQNIINRVDVNKRTKVLENK